MIKDQEISSTNKYIDRDEFERLYSYKYTGGDFFAVFGNRDFDSYSDPHIDLCWKVQQAKNKENTFLRGLSVAEISW